MSDNVALEIIKAVVSIAGAAISGVVAVYIVKIRRDVKDTKTQVDALPRHVTHEATKTRATIKTDGIERRRRRASDFLPSPAPGPDDMPPGVER